MDLRRDAADSSKTTEMHQMARARVIVMGTSMRTLKMMRQIYMCHDLGRDLHNSTNNLIPHVEDREIYLRLYICKYMHKNIYVFV